MAIFNFAVMSLIAFSAEAVQAQMPGAASFVVPSAFPTSVFPSFYVKPGPTAEPQPALFDPVLNITYPLNLTDPKTIPSADNDPVFYPPGVDLSNSTSEAL